MWVSLINYKERVLTHTRQFISLPRLHAWYPTALRRDTHTRTHVLIPFSPFNVQLRPFAQFFKRRFPHVSTVFTYTNSQKLFDFGSLKRGKKKGRSNDGEDEEQRKGKLSKFVGDLIAWRFATACRININAGPKLQLVERDASFLRGLTSAYGGQSRSPV